MEGIHEEIEKIAYELYERGGRVEGRALDYWLEAEKLVEACYPKREEGTKEDTTSLGKPGWQDDIKARSKTAAH